MSDNLIRELARDLRPVERLASPARRSACFAFYAVAIVLVGARLAGIRADLYLKLRDPGYLTETVVLLALFGAATFASFCAGIPGARLRRTTTVVALAAGAWLALGIVGYLATPATLSLQSGLACVRRTLLLSVVPTSILFAMLRRSAPLEAGISGSLAMTATGTLAVLATRVACGRDDGMHVLLWHALPLAALAVLGSLIGRICLDWLDSRPAVS